MNKVAIAFICDDNYVVPTVVAITSLIENKRKVTFYYSLGINGRAYSTF